MTQLSALNNDALVGALAALKRALDAADIADSQAGCRGWIDEDVLAVCMEMTRRGLESDTVMALEL